jgi:peptide chain release factor 3
MTELQAEIQTAVDRRRNLAIISHPDAGKTTLTEKLLLYGGAIQEAGAVKSRRSRRYATSDWMEMEKKRGISVTSTVLQFEYEDCQLNLLDTPGHQDFSEDTYRTLTAADNAVMLIDNAKGLETQTRKLFEVCRMRSLPTFTFINKMDRAGRTPLELLDEIENELGLKTYAVNYPIGMGNQFRGVLDRRTRRVYLFERQFHGQREAEESVLSFDDPRLAAILPKDLFYKFKENVELLDKLGPTLDLKAVREGRLTPVFFGSAMNNFGVKMFLDAFLKYAAKPGTHKSVKGKNICPVSPEFSAFVFKIQANMDPRHRDCLAFLRVCSGRFTKDMTVKHARSGRILRLSQPRRVFASERETIEEAYPGDVVGIIDSGLLSIGDTVYTGPKVVFPRIPAFSPELFAYLKNPDTFMSKKFNKGVIQMKNEGAVQVLRSNGGGKREFILAAVGHLQFEVVQFRLAAEYGTETVIEPLPFTIARWVTGGWEEFDKEKLSAQILIAEDWRQRPVLLFRNEWQLQRVEDENPKLCLSSIAPM